MLEHTRSVHATNSEGVSALNIPYRQLDTHTDLTLSSMFKFVEECRAGCGQIFANDQDKRKMDEEREKHMTKEHPGGQHALTPALPSAQSIIG